MTVRIDFALPGRTTAAVSLRGGWKVRAVGGWGWRSITDSGALKEIPPDLLRLPGIGADAKDGVGWWWRCAWEEEKEWGRGLTKSSLR